MLSNGGHRGLGLHWSNGGHRGAGWVWAVAVVPPGGNLEVALVDVVLPKCGQRRNHFDRNHRPA